MSLLTDGGPSVKIICDFPWKEFQNPGWSCTIDTIGKIKDTCKISCNDPCVGLLISQYAITISVVISISFSWNFGKTQFLIFICLMLQFMLNFRLIAFRTHGWYGDNHPKEDLRSNTTTHFLIELRIQIDEQLKIKNWN